MRFGVTIGAGVLATFSAIGCGKSDSKLPKPLSDPPAKESPKPKLDEAQPKLEEAVLPNLPKPQDQFSQMRQKLLGFLNNFLVDRELLLTVEFSSIERKYEKAFLEFSGAAEKKVREEVLAAFKQKHVVNLLDHLKLSDYEMHRKMYGFMSNYCADLGNIELEMAMAIAFDKPLTDENFLDRKLSERDRKALKPIIEKIRTVAAKLRSELSTSYVNQYSLDSYRYRDDIEDIGLGRLLEKHWNADDRYIVFSGGIINGALHLSLRFAEELGFKKAKGKVQSYYYLDGAKPSPKIKEDLDSWMQFQDGIKTFLGNVFTLEPMLEDDFAQVRRIFELSYLSEKHAEDKEIVAREAWVNFAEKQKERLVPEIDLEETVFSSKFPDRIGKLKGASLELAFLMREGKLLPIGLRLSDQQRAGVLRLSNRLTHMLDYLALEVYKEPWSSHVLREKLVECGRRFGLFTDPDFSEPIYARVRDHLKNYYTMGLFSGPHFVKNVKSDTPEAKDIELLKRVKAAFKQRLAESELTVAGAQELALKTCGDEGRGLSAEALLELVQKRISLFKMYGVKTTYLRMEVETDYGGGSYGIDSSPFSKEGYEDCHRLESLITKLNEHLSGEDFFGLGEDKEYKRGMLLEEVERSILAWTKENNIDSGACERLLEKVISLRAWQVRGNLSMWIPDYDPNLRFIGYRYGSLDFALKHLNSEPKAIGYEGSFTIGDFLDGLVAFGKVPHPKLLQVYYCKDANQKSPYHDLIELLRKVKAEYAAEVMKRPESAGPLSKTEAKKILAQLLVKHGVLTEDSATLEIERGLEFILKGFSGR